MDYQVLFSINLTNCESKEQAYDALLEYLADVVRHEDLSGFSIDPIDYDEVKV
jgi:hypothetical protein